MINIQTAEQLLKNRLEELSAQIEAGQSATQTVELDQTMQGRLSRQNALMQQETAKAAQVRRDHEIKRIHTALERLKNGDYGFCQICEEDINPQRLASDPSITLCLECAS